MESSSSGLCLSALKRQPLPSGENERLTEQVRLGTRAVADLFLTCLPDIMQTERETATHLNNEQRRLLSYLGFKQAVLAAGNIATLDALMALARPYLIAALQREPVESVPDYGIGEFNRLFAASDASAVEPADLNVTALISRAQDGQRIMGQIMRHNMGMILHHMNRWPQMSHMWPDMISEGLMGFQKAILRFDASRGCKLITFANDWVMQGISAFVAKHRRSVRVPMSTHAAMIKVMKAHATISRDREARGESRSWPDFPAIAVMTGVEESEVIKIFQVHAAERSLDESPVYATTDDRREPLGGTLADDRPDQESALLDAECTRIARGMFSSGKLTEQERAILHEQFVNERTLSDISRDHGVSRQRVHQIRDGALEKLRMSDKAGIN